MNFQPCPGKPFVKALHQYHPVEVTRWPLTLAQGYLAGGPKSERPLPVELGQLTLVAEPEGSLKVSEKPGSVT